jgi:hypothetical protein
MRSSIRKIKQRLMPLTAASVLLTGGIGATVLFAGGTADAATCSPSTPSSCSVTGTVVVNTGSMSLTAPDTLGWNESVNGLDQQIVDTNTAQQGYTVDDATGIAPGWNVTASATPFTVLSVLTVLGVPVVGAAGVGAILGTAGATTVPTFATNGSVATGQGPLGIGTMTDTTVPGASCAVVATVPSTCTLPTDYGTGTALAPVPTVTYPVNITYGNAASAAPIRIYSADAGSGLGTIELGYYAASTGAPNPVGWWINVPANTLLGSYVSTITLTLNTGP